MCYLLAKILSGTDNDFIANHKLLQAVGEKNNIVSKIKLWARKLENKMHRLRFHVVILRGA